MLNSLEIHFQRLVINKVYLARNPEFYHEKPRVANDKPYKREQEKKQDANPDPAHV